jgi:hypothetical protein
VESDRTRYEVRMSSKRSAALVEDLAEWILALTRAPRSWRFDVMSSEAGLAAQVELAPPSALHRVAWISPLEIARLHRAPSDRPDHSNALWRGSIIAPSSGGTVAMDWSSFSFP